MARLVFRSAALRVLASISDYIEREYKEELIKAGIMQGGGLKPTSLGKRVRFSGAPRTVINGPFAPTEEQVAGYWTWNVKSMDEAV